jgi:hypothetical protein
MKAMFGICALRVRVHAVALAAALCSACLDRPLCDDCEPETTNLFTTRIPTGGVDKVDLLFMIDGSISMADKQALLKKAVPPLLARFVNPFCVDDNGVATGEPSNNGVCLNGSAEFPPLKDIHIGVISSNLGALGNDSCGTVAEGVFPDDHAWLIPRVRPAAALESYQQTGFLAWDPSGTRNNPPGTRDQGKLATDFTNMVGAVNETGCGYEASLESWYRFLVEPNPPERVEIQDGKLVALGTDTKLLEQRAQFLRPDSLVAIVMLTDENDCSLSLSPYSYLVTKTHELVRQEGEPERQVDFRMPRGTSTCAQNPDSPCCRLCWTDESGGAPPGCVPVKEDPACAAGKDRYTKEEDPGNLRCFDQKRRFGIDFLEPVDKYIRGLTQPVIRDRFGKEAPNPLFAAVPGKRSRGPDLVFLAGIVGVPWQDIATPDSLTGPGLKYMNAAELAANNRWDLILGDPANRKPPQDPHMIESVAPRTGSHPFVMNGGIAPTDHGSPRADVISGHEQGGAARDDLQYACTFELETPRDCASPTEGCDCNATDVTASRPLCQHPNGGPVGTTQYYAKAYPGVRHLQVVKGLGAQGVLASICAKNVRSADPNTDGSFGYNPALDALVTAIRLPITSQCLVRPPALDETGRLRCVVVEAALQNSCDCSRPNRTPARAEVLKTLQKDLVKDKLCGPEGCAELCACELGEHVETALEDCRKKEDPMAQSPGFCYVDPAAGLGDPNLVKDCPGSKKRLLRFVGPDTPAPGAFAYMACMGANVQK